MRMVQIITHVTIYLIFTLAMKISILSFAHTKRKTNNDMSMASTVKAIFTATKRLTDACKNNTTIRIEATIACSMMLWALTSEENGQMLSLLSVGRRIDSNKSKHNEGKAVINIRAKVIFSLLVIASLVSVSGDIVVRYSVMSTIYFAGFSAVAGHKFKGLRIFFGILKKNLRENLLVIGFKRG